MAMTHPVIHEAFVFESDFASYFERMSMQAKACFLMTDPSHLNAKSHFHDWRVVPAFVFTCIHTIILFPSAVLVHMLDLFALLTTICCWDVMRNFMRKCKAADQSIQNGEEYLSSILSRYLELKKLFKAINDGIGLLFLCCIGISLPIYATWIAVQFFDNTVKTFDAIHFYVYFLTFLFVLSMAARINQRANEFYDWIGSSELHTIVPTNKMTVLMMDLYSNRISLSGCGMFAINFRFLVTILSIIVTYTSIIVQFQMSRTQYYSAFQMENFGNETGNGSSYHN
ncbi:unnamed protein product [Orchesella dallaii]|uniref:Gustatory receptor n=1 Tax=Orchesella dallaii TaxID=48710 RepID=A0ABP1RCN7_9HEXA